MIDKLKSLSKDTMIYGTSTIVGRFLNFLFVPVYTNVFLPSEFGIVANIYAYIAILNVFFSIGLESGYFKFASTLEVGDKKQNFTQPFLGIFINSFILSLILFIFAGDLTYVFQIDPQKANILRYTALILFFDALVLVPFAYLRLHHHPVRFAVIRIAGIVINVTFNLIFILGFRMGVELVFISNIIASLSTLLFLSPIIIKNLSFKLNKQLISELLRFSLPYIPAGISSNIIQVINRPILTAMTNDSTVGIFQANYKLGIFMMLFVSMFEFAWRPFFLQNAKEPDAKKLFSKVMTAFIVVASVIFMVLSLFIENIVTFKIPLVNRYLIGRAYWGGLSIVPIILAAYLFYGIYINLMAGIYIEKKTKYLPYVTMIAAGINVIANIILIPLLNMTGSAIATFISYTVMAAGLYYFAQKFYYIRYEFGKILMIFISLAVCYSGFYFIYQVYDVIFIKFIFLILFASSIFFLRIVDLKTLRRIVS